MRLLLQRSLESKVEVNGEIVGQIPYGVVALVSFTEGDTIKDIDYLVEKMIHLRVFDDENIIPAAIRRVSAFGIYIIVRTSFGL